MQKITATVIISLRYDLMMRFNERVVSESKVFLLGDGADGLMN